MEHGEILASLRKTGEYSDLTVRCGGYQFKVHKNVMCLRSKWFAKACQKEKWAEGKAGVISLKAIDSQAEEEDYSCDHPEAVQLMIDYIYMNDYTPGSSDADADAIDPSQLATKVPTQDTMVIDKSDIDDVAEKSSVATQTYEEDDLGGSFSKNRSKKDKKRKQARVFGWGDEPAAYDPDFFAEPCVEPEPEPAYDSNGASKPGDRVTSGTPSTSPDALTMHARLYAMGSKYDIEPLRQLAMEKLKAAVEGTWNRSDFAAAIGVAFGATEDSDLGLRDIMIKTILDCAANLSTDPVIEKSIVVVEGLSFKLFKELGLRNSQAKRRGMY